MNTKQNINSSKNNRYPQKPTSKNNFLFVGLPIIIVILTLLFLLSIRTSSITGKIFSSGDSKIILKDVKITLDNNKEFINNQDSTYTISSLKSGQHILKFEKNGYEILTENINIPKGENISFDAYLVEKIVNTISLAQDMNFIPITTTNKLIINSNINKNYKKNILIINSNIYLSDNQNNYIIVLDSAGKEINKIQLPIGSIPDKLLVSNIKDKLYTIFTNNNSIGVIDIKENKFIEQSLPLESKIIDLFINKIDNKSIIISENKFSLFNILNYGISPVKDNNNSIFKSKFSKNNLFIINNQKNLSKIDFYNINKEQVKYNLSFIPENIVVTKSDKVYISSGKNIYLIDAETGNTIKSFDIGININDIKVSPKDDNIYITDNSTNVYVFDTNKDELNKDKFTFKENIKEIFFSE